MPSENEKLKAQNKRLREKNIILRKAVKMLVREFDSNETIREQYIEINELKTKINKFAEGLKTTTENRTSLEEKYNKLKLNIEKIINENRKLI